MTDSTTSTPKFLAPISVERFFADHWGRERLIIHRDQPDFFRDDVDLGELDRLVTSVRIPVTNFNLARGDTPLPFSDYCVGSSFVDKRRAIDLHQGGATVILRSIEQWSPGLNRLRIAAEEFFRCEAQINVYLTPPGEKSTPPHWDTHDLVILQVAGRKRWRIHAGARTLPLGDERFRVNEDFVSREREEIVLHAGDTLYLPRGVIHEPVAEDYSAHVSIGLHTFRWYDLMNVALRLLAEQEGSPLREAVPMGHASGRRADAELIRGLLDPELLARASAVLEEGFRSSRAVDLEGRLLEIQRGPRLDADSRYVRRAGLAWAASATEGGLQLSVGERQVTVPPAFRAAVEYVLAHETFSAAELPVPAVEGGGVALCVALQEIGAVQPTFGRGGEG